MKGNPKWLPLGAELYMAAPSQGSATAVSAFLQSGNTYGADILKIMVRISRLIYQLKTAT